MPLEDIQTYQNTALQHQTALSLPTAPHDDETHSGGLNSWRNQPRLILGEKSHGEKALGQMEDLEQRHLRLGKKTPSHLIK